MTRSTRRKERKVFSLQLERGGQYAKRPAGPVVRSGPLTWKLDASMQEAFAGIVGADGTVPSKGIYGIRDRTHLPWRVLSRRIIEAREANAPLDQALGPVRALEAWVRELYGETDHGRAA